MKGTATTSTWDVHIGYLPPGRWDELDRQGPRVRNVVGGHEVRPALTKEPIEWDSLRMTPRWVGDDSSRAVAAVDPSLYANRGAAEWHRFLAGTQVRGEVALVISMIGSPAPPKTVGLLGPGAGVSLPGAGGFASVAGPRIMLATAPTPADGLGRADRDLALRLVNARDSTLPWWSLHLDGAEIHRGGGSQVINPTGLLAPLLFSAAGEVVAAVWISPDDAIRHYIIPWLPAWRPVLDWLGQQAIPEFVPAAWRRIHAGIGEDPRLQTTDESSALAALAQLDEGHRVRREALMQSLNEARAAADEVRHDLLFGSGPGLEAAVARVLTDAGLAVTSLDHLFERSASADLLVTHLDRRRLVEVKSASGNASERLVDSARRHFETWPTLSPLGVEEVVLVVNHQTSSHPIDRSTDVYSRPEFVASLTIPVITTLQLYHAWRRGDYVAIQQALFRSPPHRNAAGTAGVSSP